MNKLHLLFRAALFAAIPVVYCFVLTVNNAGATWNKVAQFQQGRPYVIYFLNPKIGFLGFGNNSTPIWRSTDSGITWAAVTTPTPTNGTVSDIWFSAPNDGWATIASSSLGCLWHSTDSGNTWAICAGFKFTQASSVRKTSTALCVAGSSFGLAFSLDNGAYFYSVQFSSQNTIAQKSGTVMVLR